MRAGVHPREDGLSLARVFHAKLETAYVKHMASDLETVGIQPSALYLRVVLVHPLEQIER